MPLRARIKQWEHWREQGQNDVKHDGDRGNEEISHSDGAVNVTEWLILYFHVSFKVTSC